MPTNKNAQLRYQILDRCFSNPLHRYTIDDLVNAVNDALDDMYGTKVGIRQIRDDIKYMRDRVSYNAPIEAIKYEGRKCYYRYSDSNYSIFNHDLKPEEISKLMSTIDMLGRYRGGSNGWLEEVISSLELRFGIKGNREHIVSFEQNDKLHGLEFLSELIDYAINHQPLNLHYMTYSGKETQSVIHPYHLKQYNNRWFLFGLEQSSKGDRIANRPLDRIIKFSRAEVAFIPNTFADFSKRFEDVVGVTIPDETVGKETIVLRFDRQRFPYVVSKPLHRSQKILRESDCTLQIEVRPNKELESLIFSYFPNVEIISPESIREQFKKKIADNLRKYLSVQNDCTETS